MRNIVKNSFFCFVLGCSYHSHAQLPSNDDPNNQIRFTTMREADERREKLIRFIWPDGLPINLMPKVTEDVGVVEMSDHLEFVDKSLVRQVDRLELEPLGLHSLMFLIHPSSNERSGRLAIVHAGHHKRGTNLNDSYLSSIEFFLRRGYSVVMIHMPLLGWNTIDESATLPNGEEISQGQRI